MIKRTIIACAFFALIQPAFSETSRMLDNFGVGAGIGANYAYTIGVHGRYSLDQIDLIAAVGLNNHYSLGARYNLLGNDGLFQPRIGINYGTNGDLRVLYPDEDVEEGGFKDTYLGFTAMVGARLAFGRSRKQGVALDIGYRLTDGGYREDRKRLRAADHRNHGEGGMMGLGALPGLFGGSYNLQFSVGWEMKF